MWSVKSRFQATLKPLKQIIDDILLSTLSIPGTKKNKEANRQVFLVQKESIVHGHWEGMFLLACTNIYNKGESNQMTSRLCANIYMDIYSNIFLPHLSVKVFNDKNCSKSITFYCKYFPSKERRNSMKLNFDSIQFTCTLLG